MVRTTMSLATSAESNVPAALNFENVAVSGEMYPLTAALVVTKVAVVLPSYVLLLAVTPVTVSSLAVMFAVVVMGDGNW